MIFTYKNVYDIITLIRRDVSYVFVRWLIEWPHTDLDFPLNVYWTEDAVWLQQRYDAPIEIASNHDASNNRESIIFIEHAA